MQILTGRICFIFPVGDWKFTLYAYHKLHVEIVSVFTVLCIELLPLGKVFYLVCEYFVTSFWQFSDGFLSNWPIKIQVTVRGGVYNC